MLKTIKMIDHKIALSMPSFYNHHPLLNKFMVIVSTCGNLGAIWLFIILCAYWYSPLKLMAIKMLIALIIATFIGQITIKSIFKRKRPCHIYKSISLLISIPKDYSFPSGHTTSSFACSTVIFFFFPIIGIIGYIYALCIAISRLYLFVHFLSDILFGILLGTSIGLLICTI